MFRVAIGISRLHVKATTNYESFGIVKMLKQCVFQEFSQLRTSIHKIESRKYCNWRIFVPQKWSSPKHNYGQAYNSRQILPTRPGIIQYHRNTFTDSLSVNTKVTNNVILYRYEKPWVFKLGTAFAIMAVIGCFSMVDLVYRVLCKGLWVPGKDWKTKMIEHVIPIAAIITGVIGGPLIAVVCIGMIIRSVKYIILRKGGQDITLVTYHPFRKEVTKTIPLKNVSSLSTRDGVKTYIPIKIKGHRWSFIVDKHGHFVNPDLFDNTVGVCRFQ